jgi:hypothetical protein
MKIKDNRKFWQSASACLWFAGGTSSQKVIATMYALLCRYCSSAKMFIKAIFFDSDSCRPNEFFSRIGLKEGELAGSVTFINAGIPTDPESLEKAEHHGITRYKPKGWIHNPGASLDNAGASADATTGRTLAEFDKQALFLRLTRDIQSLGDYDRQGKSVLEGYNPNWLPSRVVIIYSFSTIGGMGTGTMHWALSGVLRDCAARNGVQVKIIVRALLRGNSSTHDIDQADLNQFICLQYPLVIATGMYKVPETGIISPKTFDLLMLSSNQSNNGCITNPEKFFIHEGYCEFLFWHTHAGRKIRERLPDIEDAGVGEYGEPLIGLTASCAVISRDSSRVIGWSSNMASSMVVHKLISGGNIPYLQKMALDLARVYGLIETEQDSSITSSLMTLPQWGQEKCTDQAKESLNDRVADTSGVGRAAALEEAISDIRSDISSTYEPLIRRQARKKCKETKKNIDEDFSRRMRSPDGLWQLQVICHIFKIALEKSVQNITAKMNNLLEFLRPHDEVLAEAAERRKELEEGNWLYRRFNSFALRSVIDNLESSGRAVIDYELQVAACRIAVQDFINPLIDYTETTASRLSVTVQKLTEVNHACTNTANRLAEKDGFLSAPPNIELVNPKYLQRRFGDYLAQYGGKERLISTVFDRFLEKYDSLSALFELSAEQINELFNQLGEDIFTPWVNSTDVVEELKYCSRDPIKQQEIIALSVSQSEGSILTCGEINQQVIWLKVAGVPSENHISWINEFLPKVDSKPGKWEISIHPNPDELCIFQMRNNVSIASILKRLKLPDNPENWTRIARYAPDPVNALTVLPNPTDRQFKRVLAKAIVNDQLVVDDSGSFVLKLFDGQIINLGSCFETVDAGLRPNWNYLVFIESSFGRSVVVDDNQVKLTLKGLKSSLHQAESSADKRLVLINETAVDEALIQAEIFTDWARRMRDANKNNLLP